RHINRENLMSLSYDAVAEVARTLESEGKSVGARAILDVLKTGSMTTIQKHLFRWSAVGGSIRPIRGWLH
ncbi:DNA-binding protein, partial [Metallibacterium scheffleri]|uniref:DNA-binding protein n=1 Tax=Metallibacterium scheffleri TaxID=993689 RepID=UPI0023EFD790